MRKKGEKGAPTGADEKSKGEELMNYIERKMSTLRKDRNTNLMIPKKVNGVTKFKKWW